MTRTLCVEGWRGVNHSIAMVNQYQLLALLDLPGLRVFHRDLPYFLPHWNAKDLPAGFTPEQTRRIAEVPPPPEGQALDCVLRVVSPVPTRIAPAQKTLTFMVTEFGLGERSFDGPLSDLGAYTRDANRIVTPSAWARDRLADHGFDAARIHVVPHGVNTDTFAPLDPETRQQSRRALGYADDEVLFVNVGVSTWNKGLDLLIRAYARLRQRNPKARLLIKDHKGMYGLGIERTIAELQAAEPALLDGAVLGGISVLSGSLDLRQLRSLYGIADAYVSPYRAEGFNMPVLEAMACGTPVLVTEGGATDDFCPPALALKIASRPGVKADAPQIEGRFRVPDPEALFELMAAVARGEVPRDDTARVAAREALVRDYAWPAVTRQLAALV